MSQRENQQTSKFLPSQYQDVQGQVEISKENKNFNGIHAQSGQQQELPNNTQIYNNTINNIKQGMSSQNITKKLIIRWDKQEIESYKSFCRDNYHLLKKKDKKDRKKSKIFKIMASHIKSKNDSQCKSHHQKAFSNFCKELKEKGEFSFYQNENEEENQENSEDFDVESQSSTQYDYPFFDSTNQKIVNHTINWIKPNLSQMRLQFLEKEMKASEVKDKLLKLISKNTSTSSYIQEIIQFCLHQEQKPNEYLCNSFIQHKNYYTQHQSLQYSELANDLNHEDQQYSTEASLNQSEEYYKDE